MSKPAPPEKQTFSRSRRFVRHRFDARVRVSVFRDGETTALWGRTSELGMDGAGATLSGELNVGEVALLEFPLPSATRMMKLRAIVRYSQGLRCGFEFLVVTDEQRETLRRVCEELAGSY